MLCSSERSAQADHSSLARTACPSCASAAAQLIVCVAQVMKSLLGLARQHEVSIDSSYAALVVGVCVIVGFATNLDPELNLMDAATPALFMHNLTGRITGQLYA